MLNFGGVSPLKTLGILNIGRVGLLKPSSDIPQINFRSAGDWGLPAPWFPEILLGKQRGGGGSLAGKHVTSFFFWKGGEHGVSIYIYNHMDIYIYTIFDSYPILICQMNIMTRSQIGSSFRSMKQINLISGAVLVTPNT